MSDKLNEVIKLVHELNQEELRELNSYIIERGKLLRNRESANAIVDLRVGDTVEWIGPSEKGVFKGARATVESIRRLKVTIKMELGGKRWVVPASLIKKI